MGKRGPKPKGKVNIKWSSNFTYAIGLIVSDGNLSPDGRHVVFVSKDKELVELYKTALTIDNPIGLRKNYSGGDYPYYVVQFSDVLFYTFLESIGVTANKSHTVGKVTVPSKFFFDFLRGLFDGDGCTYSYFDPRWKSSFMFYTNFISASEAHITWLQREINERIGLKGHITQDGKRKVRQLKYAKKESLILLKKMYKDSAGLNLSRKRLKIEEMLRIIGESL